MNATKLRGLLNAVGLDPRWLARHAVGGGTLQRMVRAHVRAWTAELYPGTAPAGEQWHSWQSARSAVEAAVTGNSGELIRILRDAEAKTMAKEAERCAAALEAAREELVAEWVHPALLGRYLRSLVASAGGASLELRGGHSREHLCGSVSGVGAIISIDPATRILSCRYPGCRHGEAPVSDTPRSTWRLCCAVSVPGRGRLSASSEHAGGDARPDEELSESAMMAVLRRTRLESVIRPGVVLLSERTDTEIDEPRFRIEGAVVRLLAPSC